MSFSKTDRLGYIHTMKYYSVLKRSDKLKDFRGEFKKDTETGYRGIQNL